MKKIGDFSCKIRNKNVHLDHLFSHWIRSPHGYSNRKWWKEVIPVENMILMLLWKMFWNSLEVIAQNLMNKKKEIYFKRWVLQNVTYILIKIKITLSNIVIFLNELISKTI
jgi:hypothetical protein